MNKRDVILLAVNAGNGKPVSPVQLQKALFLAAKELSSEMPSDFYIFKPYNYGPFDASIYSDAEALSKIGLLNIEAQPGRTWSSYTITHGGKQRAVELESEVPLRVREYLSSVLSWMQRVGFQEMLRAIYGKYPQYAANSVFRG